MTENADLSKVNLAFVLTDGCKVVIPSIYAEKEDNDNNVEVSKQAGDGVVFNGTNMDTAKVNINVATQSELESLPGIGPSIANKILVYRNENGRFKTIEDLKNVPGIGEAKFNNIKNYIVVK